MGIFKRDKAIYYENMNLVREVTVTEEKVHFNLNYSSIDLKPEDVPKLLADAMQLYAHVKPTLDKKSEELEAERAASEEPKQPDDKPIDLSEIPF